MQSGVVYGMLQGGDGCACGHLVWVVGSVIMGASLQRVNMPLRLAEFDPSIKF